MIWLMGVISVDSPQEALAEVVRAELAFAKQGFEDGRAGFLANMDDQSLVFTPGPTPGRKVYDRPETFKGLAWYPEVAGISKSGDLGWTSGPYTFGERAGTYFTIWRRTAEGWKIVLDHGIGHPKPRTQPVRLEPERSKPALGIEGKGDDGLEAALAELARNGYGGVSTKATRFLREGALPTSALPAKVDEKHKVLYRGVSTAGDLAYLVGEGELDGRKTYWSRLWQRTKEGWKLVVDVTKTST